MNSYIFDFLHNIPSLLPDNKPLCDQSLKNLCLSLVPLFVAFSKCLLRSTAITDCPILRKNSTFALCIFFQFSLFL